MHRNYFIPTQAEGNSVLQLVKKDVERTSRALKSYIGLNSFHVTAMDEYEWVVNLERPPCISLYAEALKTEPLVLRFQFSSEYPAKAPLVRVVKGVPHPMFYGLKLEMKCADFWVAGESTLTALLRAVWWTSIVPIVDAHVPHHRLCTELASRYRDGGDQHMDAYIRCLLQGAEQWQEVGSKQKVSVSMEALGDVKSSLEFIRQLQLVEASRKDRIVKLQREQRISTGEKLSIEFRDARTGGVIPGLGPVTARMTPDDIRSDIREALGTESGTDVTFSANDIMLARNVTFGSIDPNAVVTVAVITPCSCCISDVDFFGHLRLMYRIKDICSRPWSIAFHEQYRSSLPETFVMAADLLLEAHQCDPASPFAMLPLELLEQVIEDIWSGFVPSRLREFLASDFCES